MSTPILAHTLYELHDKLWDMRPRSKYIYETRDGLICQMYHGLYQWYKNNGQGWFWSGSTKNRGAYTRRWKKL